MRWNLDQSTHVFVQENVFENVVCRMTAILFRLQYNDRFLFQMHTEKIETKAEKNLLKLVCETYEVCMFYCPNSLVHPAQGSDRHHASRSVEWSMSCEDLCGRSGYQGQGQVITSQNICRVWLLVPDLDTCNWHMGHHIRSMVFDPVFLISWLRHDTETISGLVALCKGNPPVIAGFLLQRNIDAELLFFSLLLVRTRCWINAENFTSCLWEPIRLQKTLTSNVWANYVSNILIQSISQSIGTG